MVKGLGLEESTSLGFGSLRMPRVLGFRSLELRVMVKGLGFRVSGLGF